MATWLHLQRMLTKQTAVLIAGLSLTILTLIGCDSFRDRETKLQEFPAGQFVAESELDYVQMINFERNGPELKAASVLSHELPAEDLNIDPLAPLKLIGSDLDSGGDWTAPATDVSGPIIGKVVPIGTQSVSGGQLQTHLEIEIIDSNRVRYNLRNTSVEKPTESIGERSGYLNRADATSVIRKLEAISKPHTALGLENARGWMGRSLAAEPIWNWDELQIDEPFCTRHFANTCADLVAVGFLPDQQARDANPALPAPPQPQDGATTAQAPEPAASAEEVAEAELKDFREFVKERWQLWQEHESLINQDLRAGLDDDLAGYINSTTLERFFDFGTIITSDLRIIKGDSALRVTNSAGDVSVLQKAADPLLQDRVLLAYVLPACVRMPQNWMEAYRTDWRIPFFSKPDYQKSIAVDLPLTQFLIETARLQPENVNTVDPTELDVTTEVEQGTVQDLKVQILISNYYDYEARKPKAPEIRFFLTDSQGAAYPPEKHILAQDLARTLPNVKVCE